MALTISKTLNSLKAKRSISIIFFSIVILAGTQAYGQMDRLKNLPKYDLSKYHFGFILAVNQTFFTLDMKPGFSKIKYGPQDIGGDSLFLYSVNAKPTPGFTIGIVGNLRLGRYFDLRFIPSLEFGERHLNYTILKYDNGKPLLLDITKNVTSTFVQFPLHVKYKSKRLNNMRAYLLGGMMYNIDLASNKNKKRDNASETYIKLDKNDLLFDIGVGFDFYTGFFKFGAEIKMSFGINDVLIRDNTIYSAGINRMNSKIFLLSFTFE